MVKLLIGYRVGSKLQNSISSASKRLWIMTPFISIRYLDLLENALYRNVDLRLIVDEDSEARQYIETRRTNLEHRTRALKNLHAKIYIVDDTAYLGSANLTESSLEINLEVLVVFKSSDEEFNDILRIYEMLWGIARPLTYLR